MVSKSERFEMRLDSDVLSRVDQWRAKQPDVPTRSEAVRRLVEVGMDRSEASRIRFSPADKLMLGMITDIHRHLKIESSGADPDFVMEAVTGGHSWALEWELGVAYNGYESDPQDVSFVTSVLDMWSFIEEGTEGLSDDEQNKVLQETQCPLRFPGFDGNNESELLSIANFLIGPMKRFEAFKSRRLNSHCPMKSKYQAMLPVFERIRPNLIGIKLSRSQIVEILSQERLNLTGY